MKFDKDIQTINETITSINNLEYGTKPDVGNGSTSNKKNSKKQNISKMEDFLKTNRARQVHPWLWQLISITLGVDPQRRENPGVVSCILELLTVGSAITMIGTQVWFEGYDILSNKTQTDILDGTAIIAMVTLHISVGIYAHRLSQRLFIQPKIFEMMKLYAKTGVKVTRSIVIFCTLATFALVVNCNTAYFIYPYIDVNETTNMNHSKHHKQNHLNLSRSINPCQEVNISLIICQTYFVSQTIFSFFFLFWNSIVAIVLVSLGRTLTMSIKKFILQLECDAFLLDKKFRDAMFDHDSLEHKNSLREYLWIDCDYLFHIMKKKLTNEKALDFENDKSIEANNIQSLIEPKRNRIDVIEEKLESNGCDNSIASYKQNTANNYVTFDSRNVPETLNGMKTNHLPSIPTPEYQNYALEDESIKQDDRIMRFLNQSSARKRIHRISETIDSRYKPEEIDEDHIKPHIMTQEEIMVQYWKLMASTTLTSQAFQRWLCLIAGAVTFWTAVLICRWLITDPTLSGILSFIFPLLIIPLLASIYAEVNYECSNILQSIMPKDDRIAMLKYLSTMPIRMTAYGHQISYATMGTVLIGIIAAFSSKTLLNEMNKAIT